MERKYNQEKKMNDIDKLKVMLPHWIEHNQSHLEEFTKWADIIKNTGDKKTARLLNKAIDGLAGAEKALLKIMDSLGCGPDEDCGCGCCGHQH